MQKSADANRKLIRWVRGTLLGIAGGLLGILAIAVWLDPYGADGRPLRMETHRQIGLPPCTFYAMTGKPCPSCGMTTSFALLMRGDLANSLRANSVGTLLAAFFVILIPWSLASALRGKLIFVRSVERSLTWVVVTFMILLVVRWLVVIGLGSNIGL